MGRLVSSFRTLTILSVLAAFLFVGATNAPAQKTRKSAKRTTVVKNTKSDSKTASKPRREQQPGEPWEGEAGVSKTMAEIQAEQSRQPKKARVPRLKEEEEREAPDRRNLPQADGAQEIAKFPVDSATEPVKQTSTDSGEPDSPQTVATDFNGLTLFDTLSFPPDTMGDIGPSQYIAASNGWIRSFNKTTGAADGVMNVDMDIFFNSVRNGTSTSDPRIRYDRLSQRWIIIIINVAATNNRVLFAVSNTQNITASTVWTYYFFQINTVTPVGDTGCFADYPTLGVDANALYIGVNNFCPNNFAGSTGYVVRKSSILSGGPIVATAFRGIVPTGSSEGAYTPQGVDNFDPAATDGYFIGVSNSAFGRLVLRRISNPGGTPTISANILLTTPSTAYSDSVPHLGNTGGTNGNLDSLDDRLFAAHLRNGRIYTAHNIKVNSTGAGTSAGDRTGSRWYEIENLATTPTLRQSGTWFDNAASTPKNFWIPSMMVSGQGHIALGGSSAGANDRVNAATIGRLATDPLGTLQSTVIYTNSTTAYNPAGDPGGAGGRRWGDYSYTNVDPEDDMTMWTIQQWNHANGSYALRVAKLLAPPPATPASVLPSSVAAGQASTNIVITGTSVNGSGFFDPGAGFAKRLAVTIPGVIVNSVTYNSPTQITVNISTVGATTGLKNVTVTNPDGQVVTANNFITITAGGTGSTLRAPADFDGDNKTDVSVYRDISGSGNWLISLSSNSSFVGVQWGGGTDTLAPGDYDGDNKTDYAVFRPSNGTWYILRSSNSTFFGINWGTVGDKPQAFDFDGDSKSDWGVFRPSNNTWYILRSGDSGFSAVPFGASGDIPVVGRYDADNKADIAVFRPSSGTWFVLRSSDSGVTSTQWGASGDIVVPGDYDNDGKFDNAVFRASNGAWYVLQSSNGAPVTTQWGQSGDIPVPGDYDGDQKYDRAVFRPSNGSWFVLRSTNGTTFSQQFGISSDKPIPAAFTN